MSKMESFALGGLGGLLPVIASLITIDLAPLIDHATALTPGNYIGYAIRVLALIILGGTIAVLNSEVKQPLALVQLGIAAPALITSLINSSPPPGAIKTSWNISFVTKAEASEHAVEPRIRLAGGWLADIVGGAGVRLDTLQSRKLDEAHKSLGNPMDHSASEGGNAAIPVYPTNPAGATQGVGQFCSTPFGRFGPGQSQPLGATCTVFIQSGPSFGVVTE